VIFEQEQVLPESALPSAAKRAPQSPDPGATTSKGGVRAGMTHAQALGGAVRIDEEPGVTAEQRIRSALELAREPGGDAGVFEDAVGQLLAVLDQLDPTPEEPPAGETARRRADAGVRTSPDDERGALLTQVEDFLRSELPRIRPPRLRAQAQAWLQRRTAPEPPAPEAEDRRE
jgi:hypothetical protein